MVMPLQKEYKYMEVFYQWIKMILGATYMDVSKPKTIPQPGKFLPKKSATWAVSIASTSSDVDYTGNLYGPMFTALGDLDPRKQYSRHGAFKIYNHFQQI
jgi:hypothetical protein